MPKHDLILRQSIGDGCNCNGSPETFSTMSRPEAAQFDTKIDIRQFQNTMTHVDQHQAVRAARVFSVIDKQRPGVEIGPSHAPFAPKSAGFNVKIVDHASADDLRVKYEAHGVALESIEDVDVVLQNGRFSNQLEANSAGWIIASHVIEHTTDVIGFLRECECVLAPEGVLSLVIPDMRCCFDFFRVVSSTGDALAALERQGIVHDGGTVFDHCSRAVTFNQQLSWLVQTERKTSNFALVHDFEYAKASYLKARASQDYIDVHHWRFTPASFLLLVQELRALDLVHLEKAVMYETDTSEFFVSLRKTDQALKIDAAFDAERLRLLQRIHQEMRIGAS